MFSNLIFIYVQTITRHRMVFKQANQDVFCYKYLGNGYQKACETFHALHSWNVFISPCVNLFIKIRFVAIIIV